MRKPQNEIDLANKIYDKLQEFLDQSRATQKATQQKFDPTLRIQIYGQEHWGESLFDKLLRERRQIPKAERLAKFRNDSVDEVDTTDLENWVMLKNKERPENEVEQQEEYSRTDVDWKLKEQDYIKPLAYDANERGYNFWLHSEEENPLASSSELEEAQDELFMRHRLDLARLFLGKEGGYSIRKFKRIFKREMEERPDNYLVLTKEMLESP